MLQHVATNIYCRATEPLCSATKAVRLNSYCIGTTKYCLCAIFSRTEDAIDVIIDKGPVKLIKQVKIAHSFSQSVSNQFHVIILSLPM